LLSSFGAPPFVDFDSIVVEPFFVVGGVVARVVAEGVV
jgi:hypothetical protein